MMVVSTEPQSQDDIQVGDIVMLKCGSQPMTVAEIFGGSQQRFCKVSTPRFTGSCIRPWSLRLVALKKIESKPICTLLPGTIVTLKSGGPTMVISEIIGDIAKCIYANRHSDGEFMNFVSNIDINLNALEPAIGE